jgi:predicted glycosyltransferase
MPNATDKTRAEERQDQKIRESLMEVLGAVDDLLEAGDRFRRLKARLSKLVNKRYPTKKGKTMPSKTTKQAKAMRAAAHNPAVAKKLGTPQKVAKEYVRADKRK